MLLYELHNPTEYKYGGTLAPHERLRCVSETTLSPQWDPYPPRGVEVENICGRFENFHVDGVWRGMDERLKSVCFKSPTPFGAQTELFHLRGQVIYSLFNHFYYYSHDHQFNTLADHSPLFSRPGEGHRLQGRTGLLSRARAGAGFLPSGCSNRKGPHGRLQLIHRPAPADLPWLLHRKQDLQLERTQVALRGISLPGPD